MAEAKPATATKKAAPKASTPTKSTVAKAAPPDKPVATAKKASARKAAAPKETTAKKPHALSPEEHYHWVETRAYFIAESDGFRADPQSYWAQAEIQIAAVLK